jgi:branched-chain amino acid transport system permease protein
MFSQQLANGLVVGLIYGLLALGLSLAFATTRIVNFAHGEMFTLGAFLGLTIQRGTGLPFLLVAVVSALAVFFLASLLAQFVLWRLETPLQRSVATIALALGLRDAMLIAFGSDSASFLPVFPEGSWDMGPVVVPRSFAWVGGLTLLLLLAFVGFVERSRWGIWMRATAQDVELAAAAGVRTRRVQTLAFGLGAMLAAAAALLVGPTWQISYASGIPVGLKAFTAAVIGGLGNLWGALLGGILLGLGEALFAGYLSSAWKDFWVFLLLIGVIVFLPRGILPAQAERLG